MTVPALYLAQVFGASPCSAIRMDKWTNRIAHKPSPSASDFQVGFQYNIRINTTDILLVSYLASSDMASFSVQRFPPYSPIFQKFSSVLWITAHELFHYPQSIHFLAKSADKHESFKTAYLLKCTTSRKMDQKSAESKNCCSL
ncbi:hypothetical protein T11_12059 [Trichinella zimbabwensis]|uniref:Uncharacterized protein n=1 Tax=Trichinella zimbabwensis TaxID=268475 RepID=A0A0V1HRL9_9BILA|nr:hypothetical protein T11_12059 [Trichinella zimbabwensis]